MTESDTSESYRTVGPPADRKFAIHFINGAWMEWHVSPEQASVIYGILEKAKNSKNERVYMIELGINSPTDTFRIPSSLFRDGDAWWFIYDN